MIPEEWKPIPGFERYEVSSYGRLRSLRLNKILNPWAKHKGYIETQLINNDGKYIHIRVHQIVALAFLGQCPPGHCIHHKNGEKHDNCYNNLEYVLIATHISSYHSILSVPEIKEIRYLYLNQVDDIMELSKLIGVSYGKIYHCIEDLVEKYQYTSQSEPRL